MDWNASPAYNALRDKLIKANFAINNDAIDGTLLLLSRHIETMAPVFKRSAEDMMSDISVNIVSELSEISSTTEAQRYFQLIGKNSNLVSDRQYNIASMLRNQGHDNEMIFNNTGLVWCNADFAFKGFIFEPLTLDFDSVDRLLDNPFGKYAMLEDLLNNHSIFSAYPKLKNITVAFELLSGSEGNASREQQLIRLNLNSIRELVSKSREELQDYILDIVSHELAHHVQYQEHNWSSGNNVGRITDTSLSKMLSNHEKRVMLAYPPTEDEQAFDAFISSLAEKYKLDDKYDAWSDSQITERELNKLEELCTATIDSESAQKDQAISNLDSIKEWIEFFQNKGAITDQPTFWYNATVGEIYANFAMKMQRDMQSSHLSSRESFYKAFGALLPTSTPHIFNGPPEVAEEPYRGKESLGFIDFYNNSQAAVTLIKDQSNTMTWIHEILGHYVFENLANAANIKDAPAWIGEAMDELNRSFFRGVTELTSKHEMFSEAVEEYLARPGVHQSPKVRALSSLVKDELRTLIDYEKAYGTDSLRYDPEQRLALQEVFGQLTRSRREDFERDELSL
ncbi:hypothetical protein [Vibrio owensii]|uniref:hypothetical protein n=1 Tax=Vibrio owensii TaxID=696485 RepID=UPI003CC5295D